MERTENEWIELKAEVQRLRQENFELKSRLEEFENNQQIESGLLRSSYQQERYSEQICSKCNKNLSQTGVKTKRQLVEQFQQWSHKIQSKFFKKGVCDQVNEGEVQRQNEVENWFKADNTVEIQIQEKPRDMKCFQQICLFGPSEKDLTENGQKQFNCNYQIYFPENDPKIEVYGNYLFPDDVFVKLIRQKNKIMEVDKVIFRKSCKQQDCNVFIFQCQQQWLTQATKNSLLTQVNPIKYLYCISIEFSDYVFHPKAYESKFMDRSISIQDSRDDCEAKSPTLDNSNSQKRKRYGDTSIYKSNFCLCVLTYFPFINFYTEFLIQTIDQIKIRRMEDYSKTGVNLQKLDIKYFCNQLKQIVKNFKKQTFNFNPTFQNSLSIQIDNNKTLHLNLSQKQLWQELLNNWAYRILRLLNKELLYEIYVLVMLEQSICFIGENSHVLTFMVYLFTNSLIKPFYYPHPCISVVFNQELLETPFTAVLGINKDSKWLEENEGHLLGKKENKVIINLNEEEIKIKYKKKIKIPKSQRLKKIIANFYKRAEKKQGGSSSKRRQILCRQITKSENELVNSLMTQLQIFFQQQLLSFMPNCQIIEHIRKNIDSDNLTFIGNELIKNVQKYMMQSRKNVEKDPFIEIFTQKQIFYVYLSMKYGIV